MCTLVCASSVVHLLCSHLSPFPLQWGGASLSQCCCGTGKSSSVFPSSYWGVMDPTGPWSPPWGFWVLQGIQTWLFLVESDPESVWYWGNHLRRLHGLLTELLRGKAADSGEPGFWPGMPCIDGTCRLGGTFSWAPPWSVQTLTGSWPVIHQKLPQRCSCPLCLAKCSAHCWSALLKWREKFRVGVCYAACQILRNKKGY